MKKVLVVGGGAAGFFAAINIKEKCPDFDVTILEKTNKVLQKVKVSGGGRCNVTNGRSEPGELVKFYPRGGKKLYSLFSTFGTKEMRVWLQQHGVPTRVADDLRVFPTSNTSQTIVDCFLGTAKELGIEVVLNSPLLSLKQNKDQWVVNTPNEEFHADVLIIAPGASNSLLNKIADLQLKINPGVPSLFTFHVKDQRIKGLQGISLPNVSLKVAGTNLTDTGSMLITHKGLSGPVVLKLSAWGARELAAMDYQFSLIINYLSISYEECRSELQSLSNSATKKKVVNQPIGLLPRRFWIQLMEQLNFQERSYGELGRQSWNKISEELTQAHFNVIARSSFKEEFVTCGGVELSELDLLTFESKKYKNLFFAGEILDIDALTGGFNFQACWSVGWAISECLKSRADSSVTASKGFDNKSVNNTTS